MQICKCSSMQVFKYASVQVCKFLGAKAPLGPLDVKVKVKAKKLRNSMILPDWIARWHLFVASMQSMQECKYTILQVCR